MAREDGSPDVRPKPRRRAGRRSYAITNFYPGYGEGNASLDRVEPVSAVRMQRILPRYDLSTARTRTSGLGPPLLETPVSVELTGEEEAPLRIPPDRDNARRRSPGSGDTATDERGNVSDGDEVDETAFTDDSLGTIVDLEA